MLLSGASSIQPASSPTDNVLITAGYRTQAGADADAGLGEHKGQDQGRPASECCQAQHSDPEEAACSPAAPSCCVQPDHSPCRLVCTAES